MEKIFPVRLNDKMHSEFAVCVGFELKLVGRTNFCLSDLFPKPHVVRQFTIARVDGSSYAVTIDLCVSIGTGKAPRLFPVRLDCYYQES